MADNNEMKADKKKNNRNLVIAIVAILILVVGFIIYMAVTSDTSSSSEGYKNLQTADDDFAAIEETLNYLDTASP